MLRKFLLLATCVSLVLAASTAASSGTSDPGVVALSESEAVLFPKVSGDALDKELGVAIQKRHAEAKAYQAAVRAEMERQEAERLRAEREAAQEAERRAQEQREQAPAPTQINASGGCATNPDAGGCWDRLAQCESGGNWAINTGNGYYGGLQFALSSWRSVGGTGYPHEHSREVQIEMGRRLWQSGGWAHWPACTSKFGWR